MLLEAAGTGCGAPGALGGMWRTWRAWVSVTFGERLGIVWVSVTFGELLLHWAGSERRPGDGSSGAGHPGRGVRKRGTRRAAPHVAAAAQPAATTLPELVCVLPHCMSVQLLIYTFVFVIIVSS